MTQPLAALIAQEDNTNLLGDNFFSYVILALGGALAVGNVMALVRPRARTKEGELERAPVARSVTMAAVGAIAAIWALATLVT